MEFNGVLSVAVAALAMMFCAVKVGPTHQSSRHSMNERAWVPWCARLRVCASMVIGCTVRMAAPCTTPHHTTHHSSAKPNLILDLCELNK